MNGSGVPMVTFGNSITKTDKNFIKKIEGNY
jgi:hypothetical protein